MKNRFYVWFQSVWPQARRRHAVLAQYVALRDKPELLADIALRGRVWRTSHVPGDPHATAFNEGRRSIALEILELTGMPPDQLFRLVDPNPERKDQ